MDSIQLSQLWTAATVLAGFQVAALAWRIKREVEMEEAEESTWATVTDGFVTASFLIVIVGVFVAPIAGSVSTGMAAKLLGVAMILFALSPFVLAGHYNLYCSWGKKLPRRRVTKQEWAATGVSVLLVIGGALWVLA